MVEVDDVASRRRRMESLESGQERFNGWRRDAFGMPFEVERSEICWSPMLVMRYNGLRICFAESLVVADALLRDERYER